MAAHLQLKSIQPKDCHKESRRSDEYLKRAYIKDNAISMDDILL